ncbi:MerR family transcriptional regulator [Microbacterium marinum]|uniref:MerR family transcriptional regulator n=1 Tax=Microbacterium marinum TaxID=421115 RepID=UPI00384DEC68
MTAGRFTASTLLTAKALRIYAERGLLMPRRVDPENGYRYYGVEQVQTGWLIGLLSRRRVCASRSRGRTRR